MIQEFILRKKNNIANLEIYLPFSSLWSTFRSYFTHKISLQRRKSIPKYDKKTKEVVYSEQEFSDEDPGDEHTLHTPNNRANDDDPLEIKRNSGSSDYKPLKVFKEGSVGAVNNNQNQS